MARAAPCGRASRPSAAAANAPAEGAPPSTSSCTSDDQIDSASVMLVGRAADGAACLLLAQEANRKQPGWMPFGGRRLRSDPSATACAFRELAEELLGLRASDARSQGNALLERARRAGALRGPFPGDRGPERGLNERHAAFAVAADALFGPGSLVPDREGGALSRFVRNREVSSIAAFPLLGVTGSELELRDGDGRIRALRRGYPLGRERVMAARELMEGGWRAATAATEPAAELAAEAGGARKRRRV